MTQVGREIASAEGSDVFVDDVAALLRCVEWVEQVLESADEHRSTVGRTDRGRADRLRLVATRPNIAELTIGLSDEVLRIGAPSRAAQRFRDVVRGASLDGLPLADKLLLRIGAAAAPLLPGVVMPLVRRRIRREASATVIDADDLDRHRVDRMRAGRMLNYNRLGEAVLGDAEADRRRQAVIELIEQPATTQVSVKLSAIAAHLSAVSFDDTVDRAAASLRTVYRAAVRHDVYVNLDMEEYRDLAITVAVFMRLLDEAEFAPLRAGIVLQAYLPDSHAAAERIAGWACVRVAGGGAPIGIRLVKGANLAMELVDAEIHGWNPATYPTKADVDASWKRLLDLLLDPRFDHAVRIGIASHNLFDIAWALDRQERLTRVGRPPRLQFEMLEGMAESQAYAVHARTGNLLMYTPVVNGAEFVAAIGYLTRRLDENTAPENFLRALFDLRRGSARFGEEAERFRAAVHARHSLGTRPRRGSPLDPIPARFVNEPDTDFTQQEARECILAAVSARSTGGEVERVTDEAVVDAVVARARAGVTGWDATSAEDRAALLRRVGERIAQHRAEIIASLVHDADKTIAEADAEVSEAVDFARYYADRGAEINALDPARRRSAPLGVVVVAPPWNFAYAIAMGGVTAALAAGNTVILKPAPQTPRIAQLIAAHCWEAGVPADALQVLPVPDNDLGRRLIAHNGVDAVILTGSLQTAQLFHSWKPSLRLLAETSGKNALVITATADLDLAIKDLVKSAFGHGGQKCSAASLAIVEASVYDDPAFMSRLADAVTTLRCGPASAPATDIAPLVEPPGPNLSRALTALDPGERWLVAPRRWDDRDECSARCWSPGVRVGVAPGSWFHQTECFGPVLGVLRARDLRHAIELQNAVGYGLTAGTHALDPSEVAHWLRHVEAGNVYVNRSITGAIVGRQPFGGWKASSVGPTAKAGGPSYVLGLRRWSPDRFDSAPPETGSFERELTTLFHEERDVCGLRSESNVLRHGALPGGVLLRIGEGADTRTAVLATAAARATGCSLAVSDHLVESESDCIARMRAIRPDRLRLVGSATDAVRRAAHEQGVRVDDDPVVGIARVELTRWSREQAVSVTRHRHGRLSEPTE